MNPLTDNNSEYSKIYFPGIRDAYQCWVFMVWVFHACIAK
jgi:hypothetical protein